MVAVTIGDLSAWSWVVLACSALLIGVTKTGLPGVGILAIPLVAMVIPAKESTGLILPMLIVGDIFAVAYYRRHAVWKYLVTLLPFAAIGVAIGWSLMKHVTDAQLGPIIGGIIVVLLVVSYFFNRDKEALEKGIPVGWWFPAIMGLIAGVTTMMANAAGPIMVIYLLAMRLPKDAFIGTGAWYFLVINCFKVPFSAGLNLITWQSLEFNLALAPLIVIGALVGVRLVKHVPQKAFAIIVQVLAVAGALHLIVFASPTTKPAAAMVLPPAIQSTSRPATSGPSTAPSISPSTQPTGGAEAPAR